MINTNQLSDNQTQSARRELYEIYADNAVKPRYKKKLIESLDEIYGYDLVFLVGLIMHSEFSGNLNVISQSNEISGISFSNGKITKIDLNDKETFMGELLIKEGFLDRKKLLDLLQDQSKPLGELLIKNNIATKEQIIGVLVKQMRLRLSKYINNTKYRVNFSEVDVSDSELSISYQEYLILVHDWVAGRFDGEWLKLHYMELSESLIDNPKNSTEQEHIKDLALSKDLKIALPSNDSPKVFSKVFSEIKNEKDQEYFLKSFHYGIITGQVSLRKDAEAASHSDSILKNIYNACSKKTGAELLETLAHILKYKPTEIDAIFQTISNYVDTYTGDDHDMKNNMFRIVLEMLSKKQYYNNEINKKYASQVDPTKNTEISNKVSEVYRDLLAKNLFVAVDKLKKLNEYGSHISKIKLYMVWAKALMIHQNNIRINVSDLERDFLQILPEDKDTAEYHYVKSILFVLKKDETAAKSSFDQATRMNVELKKYPPFKESRSFIKKLFKLSLIFAVLGAHSPDVAYSQPSSQSVGGHKLPFVYLNQYFNYKVIDKDESIAINEVLFSLKDMNVIHTESTYEVELKNSLERFNTSAEFSFLSKNDKKMVKSSSKYLNGMHSIAKSQLSADHLCLLQKNEHTNIQICKNLVESKSAVGISVFTINNQNVQKEGTVILNDKAQKISLNAMNKMQDFFKLETHQRVILPAKIEKSPDSEEFEIQFVDAKNLRIAWQENVNMNQNSFPIKLDNIITLRQGIFFNDISPDSGMSQVYIDRSKIQTKHFNKFIVEPMAIFEQVIGKSETVDATLRTGMGKGLSLAYERHLQSGQNISGALSFYSTAVEEGQSNVLILNADHSLLGLQAGYKYFFSDNLNITGVLRLREELFLSQENSTTVGVSKTLVGMFGASLDYALYSAHKINVGAEGGVFALTPNSVKGSTQTSVGFSIEAGARASYKVDWGRINASMLLGSRNQKNSEFVYSASYIVYKAGFTYLF